MPFSLTDLFPDQDYRFHLTLRCGDTRTFFRPQNSDALAERRRWLDTDPAPYAAATPDAGPLMAQMEALVASWQEPAATAPHTATGSDLRSRLIALGKCLESDFLLLQPNATEEYVLKAGVVCFPSSWALADKIGLTLGKIHEVVPGLNPAIGTSIGNFLGKLKPGSAYERSNWGVAATPELNLHPSLRRPRLRAPLDPSQTWIRVEDQILVALPAERGLLFGINLRIIPLPEILQAPVVRDRFHRALATLPPDLAAYKGLTPVLPDLLVASGR